MVRPRYLLVILGAIDPPPISTDLVVSICLRLVWCVSWNFSSANIDACLDAHCLANPSVVLRPSHVSSVVSPHRRIAMSSMYPAAMVLCSLLQVSMRSAL